MFDDIYNIKASSATLCSVGEGTHPRSSTKASSATLRSTCWENLDDFLS